MELAKYKACICEGSAEEAIIDILVDNDLLIFKREEMYGIIKKAEKGGESVGIFLPQPKRGDP